MGDYELVIKWCKTFEQMLEQGLGAQGRGLHEKVSAVQTKLPEPLVKKLRFVATIRNKLVHESSMEKLDDRPRFELVCQECHTALTEMLRPPVVIKKSGCFGAIIAIAVVASTITACVALGFL